MIKRLLQEVKQYKKASILAPLIMVLEVILELSLPLLMGMIIDQGVHKNDMQAVVFYGVIMLIIAALSLGLGALNGNFAAFASAGLAQNLRSAMFRNIQAFSFENMDKFSTSGLVTRMMTDVTNVQNAYQMSLRMLVRAPMMLIVAMFMTFYINSKLAMVFLVSAVFLAVVLSFLVYKVMPIYTEGFKRYDDLNASVQENITNIRVVKAYVKEEDEKAKFYHAASMLRKTFRKAENYLVFNAPLMQFTMYVTMIALSWFGAQMVVGGSMSTGELMSMFNYTFNILFSLMMLSMIFVMLSMSVASARRIVEVLDEVPSITNPDKAVMSIHDGSIVFEDVSFGYYDDVEKYVLNHVNLNIASGETIGILGSTGSSKTTLTSLIPRLYDVKSGSVKVGGVDVKDYDLEVLRDGVAMVLQKNVLFSGSVIENMRWGNEHATLDEVKEALHLASASSFIESMPDQYESHVEQGGSNFSGGQKQRLTIARALLKKPKILILDDSTSAVDTKTDQEIRENLATTLPEVTKIIISQRISSIQDADRILVMDEGVIIGMGTHDELLASNEMYQEVFETQKRGEDNE